MFEKVRRRLHLSQVIRSAIDTYPDGICFAASDGRPILTNRRMTQLSFELTGHTITNTITFWNELRDISGRQNVNAGDSSEACTFPAAEEDQKNSCLLLKRNTERTCKNHSSRAENELLFCRDRDGRMWQFRQKLLRYGETAVLQYETFDVTELYELQKVLAENNRHEKELHKRQKELLRDITENNESEELLCAKLRIHDNFGHLLMMTKAAIGNADPSIDRKVLLDTWRTVLNDMKNTGELPSGEKADPKEELSRVASLIGCRIQYEGDQPAERGAVILLCAAVREALTNAARHAGADRITVVSHETPAFYRIRISSNGKPCSAPVREGDGLKNLRKRLERQGATLDYQYRESLELIVTIPKGAPL